MGALGAELELLVPSLRSPFVSETLENDALRDDGGACERER
jgi:hypothetical protein